MAGMPQSLTRARNRRQITVEIDGEAANLTQLEVRAERSGLNLADGHARQPLTASQSLVIDSLPELFRRAQRETVPELDREAQVTFLSALGQQQALACAEVVSCYSSSVAMEILARALRAAGLRRVGLIHPTFDNIPDILRGVGLQLAPVSEETLQAADRPPDPDIDVLFVTSPNNPTGTVLSEDRLAHWAGWCAERGIILALDTCFRGFDPRAQYDHYRVLDSAGGEWVVIEDTGKIFPSLDLKVGFLACSRLLAVPVRRVYTDIMLGVSPAILCLVTALAGDAARGGLAMLQRLIGDHRAMLRSAIPDPACGRWPDRDSRISVERLALPRGLLASRVAGELRERDVHVLPGPNFHWADPTGGETFIRIALSRPPDDIREGAEIIRCYLEERAGHDAALHL
jgi:enduracididine biosynthesis enzyme MppP